MKTKLPILVLVLAFSGCTKVPPEVASEISNAEQKYASITKDMTREAIVAALGPPQKEDGSKATWEVRHDAGNYASLIVEFDRTGHPIKTTKSHREGSFSFSSGVGRSDAVPK